MKSALLLLVLATACHGATTPADDSALADHSCERLAYEEACCVLCHGACICAASVDVACGKCVAKKGF